MNRFNDVIVVMYFQSFGLHSDTLAMSVHLCGLSKDPVYKEMVFKEKLRLLLAGRNRKSDMYRSVLFAYLDFADSFVKKNMHIKFC